jgi:hypothetical protein
MIRAFGAHCHLRTNSATTAGRTITHAQIKEAMIDVTFVY